MARRVAFPQCQPRCACVVGRSDVRSAHKVRVGGMDECSTETGFGRQTGERWGRWWQVSVAWAIEGSMWEKGKRRKRFGLQTHPWRRLKTRRVDGTDQRGRRVPRRAGGGVDGRRALEGALERPEGDLIR